MFSILRPFLFKLDPEKAHDFAIKSLKLNLRDLIAKLCAVSGSKLNKRGLKIENII